MIQKQQDENLRVNDYTFNMKIDAIEQTLQQLEILIRSGKFEELETDTLEIKPVPSTGKEWTRIYESACAFLNTRGGFLLLGVKEEGQGTNRRYVFQGWKAHAEPKLSEIASQFTDRDQKHLDLKGNFPAPIIKSFLHGKIAIQLVDELPADRKYVFYQNHAFHRLLTGDKKLSKRDIENQEEYKQEVQNARELEIVKDSTIKDLDLDKLNEYISLLNRPTTVETLKRDLKQARPFLERKRFINNNKATTLGILVCGKNPGDVLGFRAHVHGYVDAPQVVVQDKQDFVDNVLQLMEKSYSYLLRNIQVGVIIKRSGSELPQYPAQLLRETVNNALAHRDYSIDRQVVLTIKPGEYISISNPGQFRQHLIIEDTKNNISVFRIVPEAKPRNPKLADVLRVFRKWEGRGIGMATMVNLCLQNEIDLPFYLFHSQEVVLHLCTGMLLDDKMERLFESFDGFIREKLEGKTLTHNQKMVLSYLIKSEWANQRTRYTVMLTPDNNHFSELNELEQSGLIEKHTSSLPHYPVFHVHSLLMRKDFTPELRRIFGAQFDQLNPLQQQSLSLVYRFEHYSTKKGVTARIAAFNLWHDMEGSMNDIKAFDGFYRKVKTAFNRLEKMSLIIKFSKVQGSPYRLVRKIRDASPSLFPEDE